MLIVSVNPAYIFVHIPKNAGTSIATALGRLAVQQGHSVIQHNMPPHMSLQEIYAQDGLAQLLEKEHGLNLRQLPVLCCVRNPWDRAWSRYNYKLGSARARIASRAAGEPAKAGTTEETDQAVVKHMSEQGFNAWLPSDISAEFGNNEPFNRRDQLSWVDEPGAEIHFLRFESLARDLTTLAVPLLGGALDLPHEKKSPKPSSYRDAYSDETRDFIARHFARDIETFGYTF